MKRTQKKERQLEKLQHADRASQGIYKKLIEICADLINGTRELRMAFRIWRAFSEAYNDKNNQIKSSNSNINNNNNNEEEEVEGDCGRVMNIIDIVSGSQTEIETEPLANTKSNLIGGSDLSQLSIKDKKAMMLDLLRGNTSMDKFANK